MSAIAKGARRSQSRFVGATEPLVYAGMQLAVGRNLDIISEVIPKHTFPGIKTSPAKIKSALYLVELSDALVEEAQPFSELFDLLLSSLHLLENKPLEELIVRRFELQALNLSGYTPEVKRCLMCRAVRPDDRGAAFSAQLGGIICSRCRESQPGLTPMPARTLQMVSYLLHLPAHEVEAWDLSARDSRYLARLCQAHIACHIDRELKSTGIVDDVVDKAQR